MAVKTWFITGTSRGFGREWAIAALDRGDMVAGGARRHDHRAQPGRRRHILACRVPDPRLTEGERAISPRRWEA